MDARVVAPFLFAIGLLCLGVVELGIPGHEPMGGLVLGISALSLAVGLWRVAEKRRGPPNSN